MIILEIHSAPFWLESGDSCESGVSGDSGESGDFGESDDFSVKFRHGRILGTHPDRLVTLI